MIETVRALPATPAGDEVLRFWAAHGIAHDQPARELLAQVVAVQRDAAGAVVGTSAPFGTHVPALAVRVWIERMHTVAPEPAAVRELRAATYAALAQRQVPGGPLGLARAVPHAALAEHPWLQEDDPRFVHVGFLADGGQLSVAWFPGVHVAGGTLPDELRSLDLGPGLTIAPLDGHPSVTRDDVLALWTGSGVLPDRDEALRRLHEVLLVGTTADGLAGIGTAFAAVNEQLGVPVWNVRTFVAPEHRRGNLAFRLLVESRDLLRARWVDGTDRRAPGVMIAVEHRGLRERFDHAHWVHSDFTYVGALPDGSHVRVHWFPGGRIPGAPDTVPA